MLSAASDLGTFGSFLSGVVATLMMIVGFGYWLTRRVVEVATKEFVKETVAEEMGPIEGRVDSASQTADENRQDLEELHDLLRGGNSQFEKGMMDFLDDNIERTVDIQEDLNDIKSRLDTMRDEVNVHEESRLEREAARDEREEARDERERARDEREEARAEDADTRNPQ